MQQQIDYEAMKENYLQQLRKTSIDIYNGKQVQVQEFLYTIINEDYDKLIQKYKDLNKDICKVIIYGHDLPNTTAALNILYAFLYFYIGSQLKIEELIDKLNDKIWDCYFIMCFYYIEGNLIKTQLYKEKFEQLLTLSNKNNLALDQRQSEIKLQNFRNANQIVDFFIHVFENDDTVTEKNKKKHFIESYKFLKDHNMIEDIKDKAKKLKINIIHAYLTKDYIYLKDLKVDDKNSLAIILYQLVTVDYKQLSVFLSRCNDKERKDYIQKIKAQVDTGERDHFKLIQVGRSLKRICEWEKTIDLYEDLIKSSENNKNKKQYNVYLYFTISRIKFMKGELEAALQTCKLALDEIEKFIKQKQIFYQPNTLRSLKMESLFLNLLLRYILKDDKSKKSIIDEIRQINLINETQFKLEILGQFNLQNDDQELDKLKRILRILFQYFVDDIEAKDISKIQYAKKTFGIIRDFFENQIYQRQQYIQNQNRGLFKRQNKDIASMQNRKNNIKQKTQCLQELFVITQFLKNQQYQFAYYLNEGYYSLLLNMVTLKDLAIEPIIQAQIFSFFGDYDQCFIIAQKLNNYKLMAEVYFSQMNDDKAIEYYEKVLDFKSHFILGSLYLNKSKQIQDKKLQLDYVNKSKLSFQEAKQSKLYLNKLRDMQKNSQFQEEIQIENDKIQQQSKNDMIVNDQQNQQQQLDTFSQLQKDQKFKVRDDIQIFYQLIINELAPHNQKLISQIEKFILSTRRYEIESKRLIDGMNFEGDISANVKRVIFQDKPFAYKMSQIKFDPTLEQFGGQQLDSLYSSINELNILSYIQDQKIPYVIQIKHVGFQITELNDQGIKKIEIFSLSPIYQPFSVIQAQSDIIKLQFAEKLAICLKQLQIIGISHKGIKPENVLVDENNNPVLIDFDNSIQNSRSSTHDTLNNSQIYMDLELDQSIKKREYDDIYSFGIILYELFVCKRPVDDPTESKLLQKQIDILNVEIEEIQKLIINCTNQNSHKRYNLSQVLYQFLMINPCRKDIQKLLELFMQDFQDVDITDQEYELIKEFQQISRAIPQKEMLQLQEVEQVNEFLYKCQYQQMPLLFYKFSIDQQDKQIAFRQILQCMRFIRNHIHLNNKKVENIIEFYNFRIIFDENIKEQKIQFEIFSEDCGFQLGDLQLPQQHNILLRTIDQVNAEGIFNIALDNQFLLYDNHTPVLFNFLYSYRRGDDIGKNQHGWPYQKYENSNYQNISDTDMIRMYFENFLNNLKRKSQLKIQNNISQLEDIIQHMTVQKNQYSTIQQMIEYLIEMQITKIPFIPSQSIRSDIKQFCQIAYKYLVPQDPELNSLLQKFIESTRRYEIESSELESRWKVIDVPIASGNNRTVNKVFLDGKEYVRKTSTISFYLQKNYVNQGDISELKSRLNEINIISEIEDYKIPYVLKNIHIGFNFIQEDVIQKDTQQQDTIQRIEIFNLNPIYEPIKLKISDYDIKTQYAQKVALCLKQLQMRNVSHQDIKPDNIMVDDNLDPVIIDFGISVSSFKSRVSYSKYCTLQYADPELVDFGYKNRKNDVYSFGITLYELFTCNQPIQEQGKQFLEIQTHLQNIKSIKIPEIQYLIIKCTQSESKNRFSLSQVLYQFLSINLCRRDIMHILRLLNDQFEDVDITDQEYELITEFQKISLLIPQMDSEEINQVQKLNDNLYKCQYLDNQLVFNKYQIIINDKQLAFRQLLQCMRFVRNLLYLNQQNVKNISQFYNYRLIIQNDGQDQYIQFDIFSINKNFQIGNLTNTQQFVNLLTTIHQIHEMGIFMMNFSDNFLLYLNDSPIIINFLYSFRQNDDLFKNQYGWSICESLNLNDLSFQYELKMIKNYFESIQYDLKQISYNSQQVYQLLQELQIILETYSDFANIQQIVSFITLQIKNQQQSQKEN